MSTSDDDYCMWQEDEDGNWSTECGQMHTFFDGGPKENHYRHCPYCGGYLYAWDYEVDDDESEDE